MGRLCFEAIEKLRQLPGFDVSWYTGSSIGTMRKTKDVSRQRCNIEQREGLLPVWAETHHWGSVCLVSEDLNGRTETLAHKACSGDNRTRAELCYETIFKNVRKKLWMSDIFIALKE